MKEGVKMTMVIQYSCKSKNIGNEFCLQSKTLYGSFNLQLAKTIE